MPVIPGGQQDPRWGWPAAGSAGWTVLLLGAGDGLHAVSPPQRGGHRVWLLAGWGVILPGLMENICRPKVGSCLLPTLLPGGLCGWFRSSRAPQHPRAAPCLGAVCHPPVSAAISAAQGNTPEHRFGGKTAFLGLQLVSHEGRAAVKPSLSPTNANKVLIVKCLSLVSIKLLSKHFA